MTADVIANGKNNTEQKIINLVIAEHSWEQILYHLVELEKLNPEDVDLEKLASAFLTYLKSLRELDFHIPAKIVIICAILLRMKSGKLGFAEEFIVPEIEEEKKKVESPPVEPLDIPLKRQPKRKVSVAELIDALKKIIETRERKERKFSRMRDRIEISEEDVTSKIDALYDKICSVFDELSAPITFKKLVGDWNRTRIVNNFVPLLHLAHQNKIDCSQDEFFGEIYISRKDIPNQNTDIVENTDLTKKEEKRRGE